MDVTAQMTLVSGVACPSSLPVGFFCTYDVCQVIWPVYGDSHRLASDEGEPQKAYPAAVGRRLSNWEWG